MVISMQDYINLVLVLFIYGTIGLLLIGFSAFVVDKFWHDPMDNQEVGAIADYKQTRKTA